MHHTARPSCKSKHFDLWLTAQKEKRAHLQKMASACESDDQNCVRSHMRQLLLISWAIRVNAKRCKHKVHDAVHEHHLVHCPPWVHASAYRHAITCDMINKNFRKWVKYQRCLRQRYFMESQRCASDNIPCLRRTYHSIRRIQHRLSHGHDEFGLLISKCDECAPIKLRFRKWLLRERARRHRAHLRACACATLDVECLAENVDEIKSIQAKINLRRHNVLLLSDHCRADWQVKHQAPGLLPAQHTVDEDEMKDILGDFFITSTSDPIATTEYKAGQITKIPDLPSDAPEAPLPADIEEPVVPQDKHDTLPPGIKSETLAEAKEAKAHKAHAAKEAKKAKKAHAKKTHNEAKLEGGIDRF